MSSDFVRFACLQDELDTSTKLIEEGFGNLQEISMANDLYHLPHQLLASGLERLMKCYISLVYRGKHGNYPNETQMKHLGHNLTRILDEITSTWYGGRSRQLIDMEYNYITKDTHLRECLRILSDFGQKGRYYNLDLIAGKNMPLIDPKKDWETLERSILNPMQYSLDHELFKRDYYPKVNSIIVAKIERFVRAIALQFTLGEHADPDRKIRQHSVMVSKYLHMENHEFGKNDYRRSARALANRKDTWFKREESDILNGPWPSKVVEKVHGDSEWPLHTNRVIVELQDGLFAIAYISGYAFALNGAASGKFAYPSLHETGTAIYGKSIGPLIDAALSLLRK